MVMLLAVWLAMPVDLATAQGQTELESEQPFRLNLPEWNPDPERLPPELRPMDVVRPLLPEDVAAEVAELEAKIAEIDSSWLTLETRAEQDAALDKAIELAQHVLRLRVEHQGNIAGVVRWRDAAGEPADWYEVITTRHVVADLRLRRGLNNSDRTALASLIETGDEVFRLFEESRFAEARAVTERQLDFCRRVLGEGHHDTLSAISNMGSILLAEGHLDESERFFMELADACRHALGPEHPDTLTSIGNVGYLLKSHGRLHEAELYYREAMNGFRRVLGDDHPDTLNAINNLGVLLQAQRRLSEAEPYKREALQGIRREVGDEQPNTLISKTNMG